MVRSTIACAWCRRSKIRCIHDGKPPCRNCLKSGRAKHEDCVLTGPFASNAKPVYPRNPKRSTVVDNHDTIRSTVSPSWDDGSQNELLGHGYPSPQQHLGRQPDKRSILVTPASTIVQTAALFSRKFPELAFVHLPSFSGCWESDECAKYWVHISSMLALCLRFLPPATNILAEEDYVSFAREGLSRVVMDPPDRTIVQALLTMAMYEWGNGNGYGAWMYSGMATRMMQSLQVLKADNVRTEREHEIQNRTMWGCFVMDRLIFCGKCQPLALPLERMTIHLPIGEQDFAFGRSSGPRYMLTDIQRHASIFDSIDNYYSVLVRGFDIWAKILEFVTSGGRRQPGMSALENCPWVEGSPWRKLHDSLGDWRSRQSERLQYPSSSVAVHVSLGHGESFAFVNLIYFVSVLFLNREYIPFLPNPESEPAGPVDPPLLEAVAPQNWWYDRARELFNASAAITDILQALSDMDVPLFTPFSGFCVFSAASMNLYVSAYPRMNLGRSPDAARKAIVDIAYLEKFKEYWKMGHGWCKTIKHIQHLYERAKSDRGQFQGKTRADFTALEASINDYSGVSPSHEEVVNEPSLLRRKESLPTDHAAAISLQELSSAGSYVQQRAQDLVMIDEGLDDDFSSWSGNQIWPMWGQQQSLPFAVGGLPFDFNTGIPPM